MSVLDSIPPTHASVELYEAMQGVAPGPDLPPREAVCGDAHPERIVYAYIFDAEGVPLSIAPDNRPVTCVRCLLAMRNLGRGERP